MSKVLLSVSKPLLPLFETVANSIQAIEESNRPNGKIIVHIHRAASSQADLSEDLKGSRAVTGFTVEDNGIGFNDANFVSFQTPDSKYKALRNGKGVGRLYWLKAFEGAHIESTFIKDEKTYSRVFDFDLPGDGVHDECLVESTPSGTGTKITLSRYLPDYICPKLYDTLARKIIEHFLTYFTMDTFPSIYLKDETEGINGRDCHPAVRRRCGRGSSVLVGYGIR